MNATLSVKVLQHCPDLSQVEIKAPGLTQRLWVPTSQLVVAQERDVVPFKKEAA